MTSKYDVNLSDAQWFTGSRTAAGGNASRSLSWMAASLGFGTVRTVLVLRWSSLPASGRRSSAEPRTANSIRASDRLRRWPFHRGRRLPVNLAQL